MKVLSGVSKDVLDRIKGKVSSLQNGEKPEDKKENLEIKNDQSLTLEENYTEEKGGKSK